MGDVTTTTFSGRKTTVGAMLLYLERIEERNREDARRRLSEIERELLRVAEEREEAFLPVIFQRGEEDILVRKITDVVFFSRERESFFLFCTEDLGEEISVFDFSNIKRFAELPEMREALLRNPDFHKAVIGE